MSALVGRPMMMKTRTPGLKVGWRQGLHDPTGIGILWIDYLGEVESKLFSCPKKYFNQMRTVPDPEQLAKTLERCFDRTPIEETA